MSIINLLPPDYLLRRSQKRANVLCLGLFCVVMAGVLTAAVVSEQNSRRTMQVAQRVDGEYAEAIRLIQQMQQLDQEKKSLLAKAESASTLMERIPRSYLLATLTNALPENTSLINVTMDTKYIINSAPSGVGAQTDKAAAVSAARRPAKTSSSAVIVDITGLADTDVQVARFIATLARNPLTAAVDLVYSQEKTVNDAKVREFQVKLELKCNVDVMDFQQTAESPRGMDASPLAQANVGGRP